MFNANTLLALCASHHIEVDEKQLHVQLTELNQRKGLSPVERLQALFTSLELKHITIGQSAISQAMPEFFPALVFLDNSWALIRSAPAGFTVEQSDKETLSIGSLSELPVTVVIWLQHRVATYSPEHAQDHDTVVTLIQRLIKKQPRWILDLAVATVMINLFAVISSMFAMQVYDRVVPTLAMDTLYTLVTGITVIYLVDFALKTTRAKLLDYKASKIDKALSGQVFNHLLRVQLDRLPPQLGTLTAQLSGIESVRQFMTSSIVFALVDLPFALLFLAAIYTIGGPIAMVYAGFLVVSVMIALLAQRRSQALVKKVTIRSNERQGLLVDTIRGAETIKSIGGRNTFQYEWDEINNSISNYGIKQKEISAFATNLSGTLGSIAYAAAVVIGVHLIGEGEITMGAMVACSILGGRVLGPVGQAVSYLIQYESVQQSAQMVNKFLALPTERKSSDHLIFPVTSPRDISVSGLKFSYGESKMLQVDIDSLSIHGGERIAILGSVGSGKSTFLKLLAGLYRPKEGLIKAGGVDLWSLDPVYMTKNISYMPQSPDLFKGTLKSNLTMGKHVNDTQLLHVIKTLGLDSVSDKNEKGIDMPISEGGSGLSGGQKQLVGLGRLFLNGPAVWLLDEPTASLDPNRQSTIKKALSEQVGAKDILVFATHNPKFAVDVATRIIVMENGKIIKDVPTSEVELRAANG